MSSPWGFGALFLKSIVGFHLASLVLVSLAVAGLCFLRLFWSLFSFHSQSSVFRLVQDLSGWPLSFWELHFRLFGRFVSFFSFR
ncbi:hypothetical protein C8J56DRAFT_152996 [Mycena floridula]|nr:hypothetical protein C8J56DRAFT_152996 [Mycena floridula]